MFLMRMHQIRSHIKPICQVRWQCSFIYEHSFSYFCVYIQYVRNVQLLSCGWYVFVGVVVVAVVVVVVVASASAAVAVVAAAAAFSFTLFSLLPFHTFICTHYIWSLRLSVYSRRSSCSHVFRIRSGYIYIYILYVYISIHITNFYIRAAPTKKTYMRM